MSSQVQTNRIRALAYEVAPDWPKLPPEWTWREVAAAATDSAGRVFVFNRGDRPVAILDDDGQVVSHWGEGAFQRPHGLTIGPDDSVYCVDDVDHTVKKFSPDGALLITIGRSGRFSDTGATTLDFRTIHKSAGPFNFPTNVALAPSGEIFVADGYGNARIHKFSPHGKLIGSWGEPGGGPGQFRIPHGLAFDSKDLLYVADRENSRIQRFTANGEYVDEWADVARPCDVYIDENDTVFVAELGYQAGIWPGWPDPDPAATGGRVTVFDSNGNVLVRLGGGKDPGAPGDFFAPHDIWVDRAGSIYVSEVNKSAGGGPNVVPPAKMCIQKFVRTDQQAS